jgi:hypothetical protein
MKLLETEWMRYRNAVIPKDASPVQLLESRRAFYGGAWALYALMMNSLHPDVEPTESDTKMMAKLDAEMREFGERVKRGHA